MAATSTPSSVMNTASDNGIGSGTVHAPGASRGAVVRRSARLAAIAPAAKAFPAAPDLVIQTSSPAAEALPESSSHAINHSSSTPSALEAPLVSLSQPVLESSSSAEVPTESPKPTRTNKRARVMESPSTEEDFRPSEDPDSEAIVSDEIDDDLEEPPPAKKARGVKKTSKAPSTPRMGAAKSKRAPRRGTKNAAASASSVALPSVAPEKAEASGIPPVWSASRQGLCVTLPYFNSYQGGSYHHHRLCFGFLIDADSGGGAYVDDEVVITRIGGGGAQKNSDGTLTNTMDQKEETALVQTLMRTKEEGLPVVVIIGARNQEIAVKLDRTYSVMDHFIITDIWFEMNGEKSFCKVRLEKCNLSKKSWWSPKGTPDPLPLQSRDLSVTAESSACSTCGKESTNVYAQAWMCLNSSCTDFYKVGGSSPPENMTYNPGFILKRSSAPLLVKPPYELSPALPSNSIVNQAVDAVSANALRGIVCPQCHACTPRAHWREWRCVTEGCGYVHRLDMPTLSAVQVTSWQDRVDGHALPDYKFDNAVTTQTVSLGNYRKTIFTLSPGNVVGLFAANNAIDSRSGGPDDMFLQIQETDIGLERRAMANTQMRGTMLTRHFTQNFGMPYKYIVAQDSKPLASAPAFIKNALGRLTWAGQQTVPHAAFQAPNEVLALGYFESGKIHYHDDGESTLGPTIATLSLGCPAEMTIRMKARYYFGRGSTGKLLDDDPVLPGCLKYEERLALKESKATISIEEYKKRQTTLFKGMKKSGNPPMALTMQLKHGDLVVMHGADLQKYYEHSVVPKGALRFSLTSRFIMPELIDPADHHLGRFEPAPEEIYDGN